jgi:hypothetical protein
MSKKPGLPNKFPLGRRSLQPARVAAAVGNHGRSWKGKGLGEKQANGEPNVSGVACRQLKGCFETQLAVLVELVG